MQFENFPFQGKGVMPGLGEACSTLGVQALLPTLLTAALCLPVQDSPLPERRLGVCARVCVCNCVHACVCLPPTHMKSPSCSSLLLLKSNKTGPGCPIHTRRAGLDGAEGSWAVWQGKGKEGRLGTA